MTDPIYFYRVSQPYGFMANFSRHPTKVDFGVVVLEGPTSEHPFQAMKFIWTDPDWAAHVLGQPTPHKCANAGRDRAHPIPPNWDSDIRIPAMRVTVACKFNQHPDLQNDLLATGDAVLVEHTNKDTFWADGPDGLGPNWLGVILMEVREAIREDCLQAYVNLATREIGMATGQPLIPPVLHG